VLPVASGSDEPERSAQSRRAQSDKRQKTEQPNKTREQTRNNAERGALAGLSFARAKGLWSEALCAISDQRLCARAILLR
jgi:hypothetical protein